MFPKLGSDGRCQEKALLALQNTGKNVIAPNHCFSQMRWQLLSAHRAGQGKALQSCLRSSTAKVFYLHSTVCRSLIHTNICRRRVQQLSFYAPEGLGAS